MVTDVDSLLENQKFYYDHRAKDWTQWVENYMRPVQNEIDTLIAESHLDGDILDIACGTGFWSERIAAQANSVTALDGSEEMIARLRERKLPNVSTICADIFSWHPPTQWDGIFFAHWLAHVPETHFDSFWQTVDAALLPGGHVIIIDVNGAERRIEENTYEDEHIPLARRRLKDGSQFDIVKHFWEPSDLLARLETLGWSGTATVLGEQQGLGFVYYDLQRENDELQTR